MIFADSMALPIVIATIGLVTALLVPVVTGWQSRRKAPADEVFLKAQRDDLVTEAAARVVAMLNQQLDQAEERAALAESNRLVAKTQADMSEARLIAQIVALTSRVTRLEREIIRLGGDPTKINGGTA